jgi:hypothetical protein
VLCRVLCGFESFDGRDGRFSPTVAHATLLTMSGVLGPRVSGTPGLSTNLRGPGHQLRYHAIEDARSVTERLDASLVPPDRTLFEVAIRRSLGNWIFHVPSTIAILWLSTVIVDLALVTSVLLAVLVLLSFVPAAVSVVVAAPRVLFRPLTSGGRHGYLWFLATTVMAILDCGVYGTCLFLLARAGGFAHLLPL